MIKSKEELKYFLLRDKKALKKTRNSPKFFSDEIWKYQILLRQCEYYFNNKHKITHRLLYKYYRYRFHRKEVQLGFSIPLNCFGPGLRIVHRGTIVINGNTKIGEYLEKMIQAHVQGSANFTRELRAIISLELWFRIFVDQDGSS